MATTVVPRGSRTPFLVIAIIAVAAAGGIWFLRADDGSTTAGSTSAIASPVSVPTKVSTIAPVGHGPVTTWQMPDALVGLRSIAVGADGRVWVTEQNRGRVDALDGNRLTRFGVSSTFPDAGAFSFGWGPQDALWFTGYPGGTLGRVLPDGSVNLFESRGEGATTLGIAQGADDTMWATDPNLGAVVRVGADGSVTPIVVSADGGQTQRPGFIVAGSDGRMWFTIPDTSHVAAVDASGNVTRFPVPGRVTPRNIVSTGDGTLWVSLEDRPALAKIDEATGAATVVRLHGRIPTPGLNDLALAADGSLWVATPSDIVLHVATDGTIMRRVRIPGASYSDGIAVAPDGAVWVAARDDLIAKVTP
jgi:virginiamycin B lyase